MTKTITFEGSGMIRHEEYYDVFGVKVTRKVDKSMELPIYSYHCCCLWHSTKTKTEEDRNKKCRFIKALETWLKKNGRIH